MKNLLSAIVYSLLAVGLAGCSTTLPSPPWSLEVPEMTTEGLVVVGVGYPSPAEKSARDSAMEASLTEFLRYTGMEISSYVEMITREESSSLKGPVFVQMNNRDQTRIATEGFVQKVQIKNWHIRKTPEGNFAALVQIVIPASEVERVSKEKKALIEAKKLPYLKARKAFDQAFREHRIMDALQQIPQVVRFSQGLEKYGVAPQREDHLVQMATEGLKIGLCEKALYHLQHSRDASVALCVSHYGGIVSGLPVAVQVPSGSVYRAVTDSDGIAKVKLGRPAYPGAYQLRSFIDHPAFPGVTQILFIEVTGAARGVADGSFHDFIEVVESATSPLAHYGDRQQTERTALQTARHLANARLLEMRDGMAVTTESVYSDSEARSIVRNSASGMVDAQEISKKVYWNGNLATAEVHLRLSVH